jgi:serine/threonine protein phosphatase PrpC
MAMAVAARGPLSTIATRLRADTSSFFLQPQQPLLLPRRLQLPSLVCSYGRRSLLSSVAITPSSRDAGDVLDAATRVELAFVVGASVIPHPDKVEKGGEDAYFISDYGGGVLGVADGVSGWAAEDVNPALYSRELMAHASNAAASEEMESNARLLLHKAHSATCSIGAATAIVAILDRSGTLDVANVGDCGLRNLRSGKVVFATSPQQHYFDCPYQFSSSEGGQSASDAAVFKAELLKGDTIVLGSDGLFDNVYDRDIESTLSVFGGSDQESAERSGTVLPIPTTGLSVHVQAFFLLCQIKSAGKF